MKEKEKGTNGGKDRNKKEGRRKRERDRLKKDEGTKGGKYGEEKKREMWVNEEGEETEREESKGRAKKREGVGEIGRRVS